MAKQKAWVKFCWSFGKIFNLFFIFLSIAIIAFGSITLTNAIKAEQQVSTFANLRVQEASTIMVVIGCFALICSIVGLVGFWILTKREAIQILQLYAVFISVMAVMELGLSIFLLGVKATDKDSVINSRMVDAAIATGNNAQFVSFAKFFTCCDWVVTQPWEINNWNCRVSLGYLDYCEDASQKWISSKIGIVAILALVASLVELVGVFGTCIGLWGQVKNKDDTDDAFRG